jgi:hypothetical protein
MAFRIERNAEPIPGYRLLEPVGRGGFGEVWKCEAPGGLLKAVKFVFGTLDNLEGGFSTADQVAEQLRALGLEPMRLLASLEEECARKLGRAPQETAAAWLEPIADANAPVGLRPGPG